MVVAQLSLQSSICDETHSCQLGAAAYVAITAIVFWVILIPVSWRVSSSLAASAMTVGSDEIVLSETANAPKDEENLE